MLAEYNNILTNRDKRWMQIRLIILLTMMITGYFTVSENITITRALKIFLRVSTTFLIYIEYRSLSNKVFAKFKYENILSPFFYILYLLLGFASLMWSTNPFYSLLQLAMTGESIVFVYFFLKIIILFNQYSQDNPIELQKIFGPSIFMILLVFVIGRWVEPDEFFRLTHGGEEARLGGYFMNPNELGMLSVVGLSMYAIDFKKYGLKLLTVIMFLVVFYALIMTGSRSSIIGFLLIVSYYINQSKNQKLKVAVYMAMLLSIPVIIQMIFIKQDDLEEVLSMTGRLPFWKALLSEGLALEPLFGFGFMRIAYGEVFQSVHTYAGHMTHNTFIQVLMNLGFVGFFIVMLNMTFSIRASIKSKNTDWKVFFLGVTIPIIINSLTEFGIYGETNFGILFWQFLVFLFVMQIDTSLSMKEKIMLRIHAQKYTSL